MNFLNKNIIFLFSGICNASLFVKLLAYSLKFIFSFLLLFISFKIYSQQNIREDILLDSDWSYTTSIKERGSYPNVNNYYWAKVNIPHNYDSYAGYRRLLHGNEHGNIWYKKIISLLQPNKNRQKFLFFEGVGSYAKIYLNGILVGEHFGGRTTFTIDVTKNLKTNGTPNELLVEASHLANIQDLPWVCGGCSKDRGFSEGSQPMGIFRPVHLLVTNKIKVEPFGVHAWAIIKSDTATLNINTTIKNYDKNAKSIEIINQVVNNAGKIVKEISKNIFISALDSFTVSQHNITINNPVLWNIEKPYLYKIITLIKEQNKIIDNVENDFGFRTVSWKNATHQFKINDKSIFINGVAEYEHLFGQSHAFSNEQIEARIKWLQASGFNALRDAHQPHNLLYGNLCNKKGIIWWTQFSAHVWYDTKLFRDNFKKLLTEWVIERRNDASLVMWGLQNESKLPEDFAKDCTELIRSLDPTASTERLITTCNGGAGTDWDVPQNWSGTYSGNVDEYDKDLKKQILVGEYGAWRTLDLHTEGGFNKNGENSEDKMTALLEQKIKLAESVKDSVAGHFQWLLISHENPGRVQGGEGLREQDRIGPVNYKGLLTLWEEPTDAYYMYRSNFANKFSNPMVYIASHTWPNRWIKTGIKDSIIVYSNCDEVELFNDLNNESLGKKTNKGLGTHFQWDNVDIKYNILYAIGYVNGKAVSKDIIKLIHLPEAPVFTKSFYQNNEILKPIENNRYFYRINCGGANFEDSYFKTWENDKKYFSSWTNKYKELPKNFASQRRTFSPISNTQDEKLFQTFRYGKNELKYEFEINNGTYDVELFFIEPWLGIGGGIDASKMRLFDIEINNIVVQKDFDIWNAVGTNKAIKKTYKVLVKNGKIVISFPTTKVGQALISAIAISEKSNKPLARSKTKKVDLFNSNLDIGDYLFKDKKIQINSMPSFLFGADWIQLNNIEGFKNIKYVFREDEDVFMLSRKKINSKYEIEGYEFTKSVLITDCKDFDEFRLVKNEYNIFKKRFNKNDTLIGNNYFDVIFCKQPANNIQPAYDLKPIKQFKSVTKNESVNYKLDTVANRLCAIVKDSSESIIVYPFDVGVGDKYSITLKYFSEKEEALKGEIILENNKNSIFQIEQVYFSQTKKGKWNLITINTSSMINAGNYNFKIKLTNAKELVLNGIDVQ